MLLEAHYRAVLNFFYFMLLDEDMALNAAFRAAQSFQKKKRRLADGARNEASDVLLVECLNKILEKYKNIDILASEPPQSEWKVTNRSSLMLWKDFVRKSDRDVAEVLVLHSILRLPVPTIAKGLDVPEGTVYFRLGRGLETFAKRM